MKLTKIDKLAFVRAVMNDVPQVDYNEMVRNLAISDLVSRFPDEIKAIWKNPALRAYIARDTHFHYGRSINGFMGPSGTLSAETKAEILRLDELNSSQLATRRSLKESVQAVINGCSTLKQAKDRMPEFEKYLPSERAPVTQNLPAISNVVAELTKVGWPKNAALSDE
ncbi:MAG: Nmad5 family putative nucleotide modification protein [Thiobacillus sp.]